MPSYTHTSHIYTPSNSQTTLSSVSRKFQPQNSLFLFSVSPFHSCIASNASGPDVWCTRRPFNLLTDERESLCSGSFLKTFFSLSAQKKRAAAIIQFKLHYETMCCVWKHLLNSSAEDRISEFQATKEIGILWVSASYMLRLLVVCVWPFFSSLFPRVFNPKRDARFWRNQNQPFYWHTGCCCTAVDDDAVVVFSSRFFFYLHTAPFVTRDSEGCNLEYHPAVKGTTIAWCRCWCCWSSSIYFDSGCTDCVFRCMRHQSSDTEDGMWHGFSIKKHASAVRRSISEPFTVLKVVCFRLISL